MEMRPQVVNAPCKAAIRQAVFCETRLRHPLLASQRPAERCEPSVWHGAPFEGIITRMNPTSYRSPRVSLYVGDRYPREAEILAKAGITGMAGTPTMEELFFPDLVFANAISGVARTNTPAANTFPALRAHIRRGLFDIKKEELPMASTDVLRAIRYTAAGDAMLLEYCNGLDREVGGHIQGSLSLMLTSPF